MAISVMDARSALRRGLWLGLIGIGLALSACNKHSEASDNVVANADNVADNLEAAYPPPPANDAVFCDAVKMRLSRADCDDVNSVNADVSEGTGAFNVPDPMYRNKPVSIHLFIDRRPVDEVEAIDSNLEANAAGPAEGANGNAAAAGDDGTNASAEIPQNDVVHRRHRRVRRADMAPTPQEQAKVLPGRTETLAPMTGRFMSADLSGAGFKIEAVTPKSQEIPERGQAAWEWKVTPLDAGKHWLTLTTTAEADVGGKRYTLATLPPTTKTVEVDVTWSDRIGDLFDETPVWLKRIAAVLGALAALLTAWWGLRKAAAGQAPPPGQDGEPKK
jgi:hypothetical protein